jgi:PAS domain-containing protein
MTELLLLAGAAFPVSLAALWLLGAVSSRRHALEDQVRPVECHFLFRGDTLVDHDAGDFLAGCGSDPDRGDWDRLRDWLGFRFPDLPPSPAALMPGEVLRFHSHLAEDYAYLDARASSRGAVRLRLCEDPTPSAAQLNQIRRSLHAADAALQVMRAAPYPAWISDEAGVTVWENTAATALPDTSKARMIAKLSPSPDAGETVTRRVSVPVCGAGEMEPWFDVTVERKPDCLLVFATDVSALVAAENAQQGFVSTLGKTFADLPTGLAVFDRAKTLATFNPALIDLTGLPVEFLSTRPEIVTFFDMLRDRQVMPEPKNYASWRSQINEMVSAAHGGHYREMWSLVNGQSYRVTGRPHPDGAVAFLFEDITVAISETRQHRGELALRDALMDHVDAGIAVLSRDRRVLFCNRTFRTDLELSADALLAEMSLSDVMQACEARFPDSDLWSDITRRITSNAVRDPVTESISLNDPGAHLDLQLAPLGQGRVMLSLHRRATDVAARERQHTG